MLDDPFILFIRKYLESQLSTLIKHYDEEITYKILDFSICTGNGAFLLIQCAAYTDNSSLEMNIGRSYVHDTRDYLADSSKSIFGCREKGVL